MCKYVALAIALSISAPGWAILKKPSPPPFDILHYKVDLTLNGKDLSYTAKAAIKVRSLVDGLKAIPLHYKSGTQTKTFDHPLKKGEEALIQAEGSGKTNEREQDGLFAVRPDPKAPPQFFTQFESQGARKVFPCFDEPFDKATTEVTITAEEHYTLLSNGEKIGEEKLPGGLRRVHFRNDDPISTYHITFVAADLEPLRDSYSSKSGKKIPLTIYAPPGKSSDVRYAMEVLKKSLLVYEEYFGVAYPWNSYGIVAVNGFAWGGMENKGLANLNAARLLWNKTHPLYKKTQIAGLVAHELAHEWFGNMVTMKWWDDLWLNEAFATFMTDKLEENLFGADFVAIDNDRWLSAAYFPQDRGILSHPIVPDQVDTLDELFDSVTYAKGVQVVRMLEDLIGPEKFKGGLRDYFAAHRLGNATTADFIGAMEKASGKNLQGFARVWLHQRGYPRLKLKLDPLPDVSRLTVIQEGAPFEFQLQVAGRPLHISKKEESFLIPARPGAPDWPAVNQGGRALIQYEWTSEKPVKPVEDADAYVRFETARRFLESPFVATYTFKEGLIPGELRNALKTRLGDPNRAVALGISWAMIDNRLKPDFAKALARGLWEEVKRLYENLSKSDPLEAGLRQQLLTLLGQADKRELDDFLARQAGSDLFDDKLGALAGLLRSRAPNRYAVFEEALRRSQGVHHAKLELLRVLALTPNPEVLARINQYLFDETLVAKDDSTIPIRVWRTVGQENKGVVYTPQGVAEVAGFVKRNMDRPSVAGEALRTLEGAREAPAALKPQIRQAMEELLKAGPADYVKSLGQKILAAAKQGGA